MESKSASGSETKPLPDELVEMIIACMPYPSIFKARCLSKSWRARFAPADSQPGEVEKYLAASFQKRVRERSINWGPFFPVAIGREHSSAYSWASQTWVPLPRVHCMTDRELEVMPNLCMNGAPMVRFCWPAMNFICVANIFTRKWRKVPLSPNFKNGFGSILSVSDASSDIYKLILFHEDGERFDDLEQWSADVYDSKSHSWSTTPLVEGIPILGSPAYLNGLLYMLASFDLRDLLILNLEDGTSKALKLKFREAIAIENVDLVVCNGKLLMIVDDLDSLDSLRVLEIDLKSRELLEVTRGPPPALGAGRLNTRHPVSHGGCIFFGMHKPENPKLVYNVHKNAWSCFHLSYPSPTSEIYGAVPFEPGLNPFIDI